MIVNLFHLVDKTAHLWVYDCINKPIVLFYLGNITGPFLLTEVYRENIVAVVFN